MRLKTAGRFVPRHLSSARFLDLLRSPTNTILAGDHRLFASGGDALSVYLASLPSERQSVILPAYTCDRVVSAVRAAGRTPSFVDVNDQSGVISPEAVSDALTDDTLAVVGTHIYGNVPKMNIIRSLCDEVGAVLIEDAALSMPLPTATEFGVHSHASVLSFGRGKPVSIGNGGQLVMGQDLSLHVNVFGHASEVRSLLSVLAYLPSLWTLQSLATTTLGVRRSENLAARHHIPGAMASRITRRVASQVLETNRMSAELAHRTLVATLYTSELPLGNDRIQHLTVADPTLAASGYAILVDDRQAAVGRLREHGIDVSTSFSYSAGTVFGESTYPSSESIAARIIVLPNHAGVSLSTAAKICDVLARWTPG